jgi:hypothetical protein
MLLVQNPILLVLFTNNLNLIVSLIAAVYRMPNSVQRYYKKNNPII